MNIASRLRLCALPLAVSLALSACGGAPAPAEGQTPAEASAATAAAEGALPAGWPRVAGAEMPAVLAQKAVLPAKVHSDDGADIEVADTSRIIAGGDDVIAVIEVLGLGKQVFAAPTNTTTQAGLAAPHQFLFNRTTGPASPDRAGKEAARSGRAGGGHRRSAAGT
ncbi:hypothetical protein G6F50_016042 [Rhizopus delemar]|uniref:Uncharacterized protein n=1 Tax=Rhizopus delemar TaxID=936053 RepID=A0A9P6XVA1_9FUNG|nr:hypothetical protein G6F50_016042 [Rhizopus delemar]